MLRPTYGWRFSMSVKYLLAIKRSHFGEFVCVASVAGAVRRKVVHKLVKRGRSRLTLRSLQPHTFATKQRSIAVFTHAKPLSPRYSPF